MQSPRTAFPQSGKWRPSRTRIVLLVVLVALLLVLAFARGIAGVYTDYLWFDSLGVSSVWAGVLWAKGSLALLFGLMFFVLLWVNLVVAARLAPTLPLPGPEEDVIAPE